MRHKDVASVSISTAVTLILTGRTGCKLTCYWALYSVNVTESYRFPAGLHSLNKHHLWFSGIHSFLPTVVPGPTATGRGNDLCRNRLIKDPVGTYRLFASSKRRISGKREALPI